MAFLEWTAEAAHTRVRDGADSFLIENGWIVAQTIHYTVEDDRTPDTPRQLDEVPHGVAATLGPLRAPPERGRARGTGVWWLSPKAS